MKEQGQESNPCHDTDLALGLLELLGGEGDGQGEHLWDFAECELAGELSNLFFLDKESEDWGGEDIDWRENKSSGGEDDQGILHVDAKHVDLSGPECQPTQGLQRASHPQLPNFSFKISVIRSVVTRKCVMKCFDKCDKTYRAILSWHLNIFHNKPR